MNLCIYNIKINIPKKYIEIKSIDLREKQQFLK